MKTQKVKHVYLTVAEFTKELETCLTIIKERKGYYVCEYISPALYKLKSVFINKPQKRCKMSKVKKYAVMTSSGATVVTATSKKVAAQKLGVLVKDVYLY